MILTTFHVAMALSGTDNMSWKAHYSAAKSGPGPQLNNGSAVTPVALAYTPSTQLGWADHFKDLNAAAMDIKAHIGNQMAAHLTDNAADQASVGGAIANALSK
jgi:hypothetical protein